MRLSIAFVSSVLAVLVSSCDVTSAGQTNISKMEMTGAAHPEGLAPIDNRSLRGYKVNEDEDRGLFGTAIDDIVKKLSTNGMTLSHAIQKKRMNKYIDNIIAKGNYMDELFSKKDLKKMEVNTKLADRKFLEWYAISKKVDLTNDAILAKLRDAGYEALYLQYVVYIKELKKLG